MKKKVSTEKVALLINWNNICRSAVVRNSMLSETNIYCLRNVEFAFTYIYIVMKINWNYLPEYLNETMHTWPKTIQTMLNDRRPCTVEIVSSPIDLSHICLKFLRTEKASNMFTAVPENEIRNHYDSSLCDEDFRHTLTSHRLLFRQRLGTLWTFCITYYRNTFE